MADIFTELPPKKVSDAPISSFRIKVNVKKFFQTKIDPSFRHHPQQNRCSYKFRKILRKTSVLESLFNKVARLHD